MDVHCWRFVFSSFRLLIEDLQAVGKATLRKACLHHEAREFYIALSDGAGPGMDRNVPAGLIVNEFVMWRV